MQVRSARPKFLSMAAVSARHTVRARQRQRGTGRKAAGISIPRRSRRFPFNHQNRTRAPTSLYKCTWRRVASRRSVRRRPREAVVRAGGPVSGVVRAVPLP
jgi:hypothetical protein